MMGTGTIEVALIHERFTKNPVTFDIVRVERKPLHDKIEGSLEVLPRVSVKETAKGALANNAAAPCIGLRKAGVDFNGAFNELQGGSIVVFGRTVVQRLGGKDSS